MSDRWMKPGTLSFSLGLIVSSIIALFLILFGSNQDLFLWVNKWHHPIADAIFSHFTHVGDGLFYAFIILISLFIDRRWFFTTLLAFTISSLISILCKEVLFHGVPRPKLFFEQAGIPIRLIDGVQVHSLNSFPSGHTITAFSVFLLFALYFQSITGGLFSLMLALLAGFSRVYIAQHFPVDVLVGAWVGFISSILVVEIMFRLTKRYPNYRWDQTFWNKK